MPGVLVEGLNAQRAAQRDHMSFDLEFAHATALLDRLATDRAVCVPIFNT